MNRFRLIFPLLLALGLAMPAQAEDGGIESLRETGKAFASIAREVSPSVVFIQVESRVGGSSMTSHGSTMEDMWPFGDELFKRFFGESMPGRPHPQIPQRERRAIGQGSGFVLQGKQGLLSDKTYIITNNHVLQNAERIRVQFQDGRELDAEVTGRDPQSDVAVIEVKTGDLPALPLGDSSKLEVGEWVVAIGNPFGLSHTLTAGVVSATGRTSLGINDYEDFIQTDAAINPGNSGGPLVNLNGEVVGMNTAIFSRSGGYMGVGFAIPINLAEAVAQQLIEQGEVTRGFLGIVIQQLTPELADSFDLDRKQGILVSQVSEDSPAARAGLRQGDVITAYRGRPVDDIGQFRNAVALTAPGTEVTLKVLRDGKAQQLDARIGKLTEGEMAAAGAPGEGKTEFGLTVQTLTPQLAKMLGIEPSDGIVVTEVEPGSVAARAGIETGAVILGVNRRSVKTVAEFRQAIEAVSDRGRVVLLIRQDGMQRFVALSW